MIINKWNNISIDIVSLQTLFWTNNTNLAGPLVLWSLVFTGYSVFNEIVDGVLPDNVLKQPLSGQTRREALLVYKLVEPEPDQHRDPASQHCNDW